MSDSDAANRSILLAPLDAWGALWLGAFELVGGISYLLIDVIGWIARSLFQSNVRIGRSAIISQIVRVGVRSIGIVMLVSGAIGVILALQMEPPLADFGQVDKIANIVGIAVLRELGPLIAAIVLTGFAGAAIAAEIGTMVVGEEIEALEAMALDPVRFLVVPRVIATTLSLLILTVIGDITAVVGAGLIGVFFLDVPLNLYITNTLDQVIVGDFLTGLVKGTVFGTLLALVACHNGLQVTAGAAGVGRATTSTVVQTVVLVVITDLIFTAIFYALGWT